MPEMIVMNPEKDLNLIRSLRTAQAIDMTLQKDLTLHNDVLDAFGLCLLLYIFEPFRKSAV